MKKYFFTVFLYSFAVIIAVPAAVTSAFNSSKYDSKPTYSENIVETEVKSDNEKNVSENIPKDMTNDELEQYIKGVLGAEMPALFEKEALKAQAVAARTYALRQMKNDNSMSIADLPEFVGQAYADEKQLKEKWGANYDYYYSKISEAVDETAGEILVYEGEPILAVFHSTSGGFTEDSENVWEGGSPTPYLRSVDSIGDENADGFVSEMQFTAEKTAGLLQKSFPELIITDGNIMEQIQIIERTSAGYVKSVQIGNKILTGRQVRECLGLKSSNFTIRSENGNIVFITKGYGHGVGMSQYGANFMAKEGHSYDEILKHYYTGVSIEHINDL